MASINSMDSTDSDIFLVEQLSKKPSPQPNISPNNLNSTQLSEPHTREMPTTTFTASP